MKKIGKGLQYNVYHLTKNRVIKKQRNKFERLLTLFIWKSIKFSQILKKLKKCEKLTKSSIKGLIKLKLENTSFLGNPEFLSNLTYKQDKVITIKKYFKTHPYDENTKIIDEYIENIFQTWKKGFSDTIFNFTINNGINKKGKVILIDLGELTFSKNKVIKLIKSKKWLKQYSYLTIKDIELKHYFKEEMKNQITIDNLNKYWETELEK